MTSQKKICCFVHKANEQWRERSSMEECRSSYRNAATPGSIPALIMRRWSLKKTFNAYISLRRYSINHGGLARHKARR